MNLKYSISSIKCARKQLHSWTYVLILQYPIIFLTWLIANFTPIIPEVIATAGIIPNIISGYFFYKQNLLLGAFFYLIAWIMDAIDGKLARTKGLASKYGAFIDNYMGGIGFIFMFVGFTYGLAQIYNNLVWFALCFAIYFFVKLRSTASLKFYTLVGDSYKEKVRSIYENNQNILSRVVSFFSSHGMVEPFNIMDILVLILLVGPIMEYFFPGTLLFIVLFGLVTMILKEMIWFKFYRRTLLSDK